MTSKSDTRAPARDDLDNFFLDGDLDDDPFASPKGDKSDSNKRKEPGDGLGLDEEVSVAKKARVPRVKLDQERLLSQKGIPALRKRARGLKLKGKGHEWGDASRLMSFYQEWLDDLFPKAKFVDSLAMVEKVGHKSKVKELRVEWINEGRPKPSIVDEDVDALAAEQDQQDGSAAPKQAERVAPIFEKAAGVRMQTPEADDLFGDVDDIYNATPIGSKRTGAAAETGGEPDDDELDALMAEAEAGGPATTTKSSAEPYKSLFGDGKPKAAPAQPEDDDDLDALVAEAEAEQGSRQKPSSAATKNSGEALRTDGDDDDMDDLDALMAEAEAETESAPAKSVSGRAGASAPEPSAPDFDADEEAMAEMDGLW